MFSRKDLMILIIPLIIEQVLAVTIGLVDGIMVSSVGEAAVSGISLVDSINILLLGLFGALATGGAVVSAQFLGSREKESACRAGEQLIVSILSLSLIITFVALLFGNRTLNLLYGNVAGDVMYNARIYFFYSALSFPFIALYNACAALFRTMGNAKITMWVSLFMNILHILINIVVIYFMHMGVAGAAISTLISRCIAAVILFALIKNKQLSIHIRSIRDFRPDYLMIKRILRIGVPNGLENSVFQIGKILVQGIVAGLGTTAITANAIAGTMSNFAVLPGSAIALALVTVVGRCMGAGDYSGVKRYTYKLLKIAYVLMTILNLVLIFMIPNILKLYNLSKDTSILTTQLITYYCILCCLIWPLSFSLPSALRATNDVKFTLCISMVSMWVWRIAFSYILAITFDMGVLGIWIAMTIDWLFRAICFVYRFKKEKYKNLSAKF